MESRYKDQEGAAHASPPFLISLRLPPTTVHYSRRRVEGISAPGVLAMRAERA